MDSNTKCEEIVNQIEYYFSDINLINDSFLNEITQKDNGWVSIETLLKFNRLKALTNSNRSLIINSVMNSNSDLIELNESKTQIRRKLDKPLPEVSEEYKQCLQLRTVHIKGFPKDITLDEIKDWIKEYGECVSIQMRRKPKNNEFKGCIFVVFNDQSIAENIIDQKEIKYNDNVLLKENKIRYFERKREFFAEKRRIRVESKKLLNEMKCETNDVCDQDMKDIQIENPVKVKSAVLKLKGLPKSVNWLQIKNHFKIYANISYFHRTNANGFAFIRFANNYDANNVLAVTKIESEDQTISKLIIDKFEVNAEVITGEEEKQFWIETKKNVKRHRKMKCKEKMANKLDKNDRNDRILGLKPHKHIN